MFSCSCTSIVDIDEDIWDKLKDENPDISDNDLFRLYVDEVDREANSSSDFWSEVGYELEVNEIDYDDVTIC